MVEDSKGKVVPVMFSRDRLSAMGIANTYVAIVTAATVAITTGRRDSLDMRPPNAGHFVCSHFLNYIPP